MPRATGQLIHEHRDSIAARWLAKARAIDSGELTSLQLMDSMHLFIDDIVASFLAGGRPAAAGARVSREHGRQRQGLDAGLARLIREYSLCFDAVVEVAAERGAPLDSPALTCLSQCMFAAAAQAADEYAERELVQRRQQAFEHFAFIAHELRGPLTAVRLAFDTVSEAVEPGTARLIERNLDRTASLIDDAIVEAKLQAPGARVRPERLSLAALVDEIVDDAEPMTRGRAIAVSTRVDRDLVVDGDRRLLYSAISNLTRNAIKFSHHGGRVRIASRVAEGRLLVSIEDECGGLSVTDIEAMFGAFQQTRADRSGFGLGLALSKEAVEAHHGTLNVENIDGVGCRFVVDLPYPAPTGPG